MSAKRPEAESVMAFGQAVAGLVFEQRTMIKPRRGRSKCAAEKQLAGCGAKEFFSANNFSDVHGGVIDNDRELIRGNIIMPPHYEITEILSCDKLLRSVPTIDKRDYLPIGHAEAPVYLGCMLKVERCGFSLDRARLVTFNLKLGIRRGPARARINWCVLAVVRRLQCPQHILARAGTGVNEAAGSEFFESGHVERTTFTLRVGSERSAAVWTFLPTKAEPSQIFQHGLDELRPAARAVQILVSKNEGSMMPGCPLLCSPKRSRVTQVEMAGGRRRQTAAILDAFGVVRAHGDTNYTTLVSHWVSPGSWNESSR